MRGLFWGIKAAALLVLGLLPPARAQSVAWLIPGHSGGARASAVSATLIATGGEDGSIHLWSAESNRFIKSVPGHRAKINQLAFSPTGDALASASSDGTLRIYDIRTDASRAIHSMPGIAQTGIAFQTASNRLASISATGDLAFWNAGDASLAGVVPTAVSATRMALSSDGNTVAIATGSQIKLLDLSSRATRMLAGHTGAVRAVAFSPDGRTLVSGADSIGSDDHLLRVWDTAAGEQTAALSGHAGGIRALAFAPNPNHVVTAAEDGIVKVWDLAQGKETGSRNIQNFECLSVSPDARFILVGSEMLNPSTLEVMDLLGHVRPVKSLAFSPDGTMLVSDDELTPRAWRAATGEPLFTWSLSSNPRAPDSSSFTRNRLPVSFSPDGQFVLAQDYIWSRRNGARVSRLPLSALAVAPNWETFALPAGGLSVAKLYRFPTGEERASMNNPVSRGSSAIAYSTDGALIATAGGELADTFFSFFPMSVWTGDGAFLMTVENRQRDISSLAFSPDKRLIASFSEARGVDLAVAHVQSGVSALRLTNGLARAGAFAFFPNSRHVVWGHDAGLEVWDLQTASRISSITNEVHGVTSLAVSPDGGSIAVGRADGTVLTLNSPLPPDFDFTTVDSGPRITLRSATSVGGRYQIESTSDFKTWTPVQTFTATEPHAEVALNAGGSARFLRFKLIR